MKLDPVTAASLFTWLVILAWLGLFLYSRRRRQRREARCEEARRHAERLHELAQGDPRFAQMVDRDGRVTYAGAYYDPAMKARRRARLGLASEDGAAIEEARARRAEAAPKIDQYNPRSGEAVVFGMTRDFDLFLS